MDLPFPTAPHTCVSLLYRSQRIPVMSAAAEIDRLRRCAVSLSVLGFSHGIPRMNSISISIGREHVPFPCGGTQVGFNPVNKGTFTLTMMFRKSN